MSGTFSSLSSALSALRYNRTAMDVASANVANASTEGYARRRVVAESVGPPAVPALWSRWDGASGGVKVGGIDRMVDPFLDARARTEHGRQALLEGRRDVLARLETALGEPGDTGVASALSDFRSGWQDVANNPGDGAARDQLLDRASTLTSALGTQARAVTTEWADQRSHLDVLVTEVNGLAADLARANESIRIATVAGTDTGTLLDQRDQLALRLAELTGASTTAGEDGTVDVRVGGVTLVSGSTASVLQVSGATSMAAAGADPVRFSIGGAAAAPAAGSIGAAAGVLATELPDYLDQLDAVARTVAESVNAQHAAGYDLDGAPGRDFFTGTTAATLSVALTDPDQVAASATPGTLDGSNADALFELTVGADSYRRLVTDFGSQVASARRVATNQLVLTNQIDGARESLSGIDIDEEMVNMLAHQRAYEGAARVLTTLDSVLDTLINRTGLVR